jgi:hypothetical protein
MNELRCRLTAVMLLAAGLLARARGDEDARPSGKRDLRGGGTVELIGVSTEPPGPKVWWGPDGLPLDQPPFDGLGSSTSTGEKHKARVFAIRVSGVGGREGLTVRWDIPKSSTIGVSEPPRWVQRPPVPGVHGAAASLPAEAATCTVRVGVADGHWKTEATTTGQGIHAIGTDLGTILFASPRAIPGGAALVVADTISGPDVRIVAVDRDGIEHGPMAAASSSAASGTGLARLVSNPPRLHDLEYPLPPDRIREFRFQTRSYQWAEFRDVPLEPRPEPGTP